MLIVDARHNGPPGSGNGGWTAGLIAGTLAGSPAGAAAEVTLRQPPPLQTELSVQATDDGLAVHDPAGLLIASARWRTEPIEPVPPVSRMEALAATSRYPGHGSHHFPTCFVCGPARGDGLRIYPGRLPDGGTAALFEVPPSVPAEARVLMWAALDCPGGWTVIEAGRPWVLGRIAVDIDELPEVDDECVIVGRPVRRDGRKAVIRTTAYGPTGALLARAEATWIELAPRPAEPVSDNLPN
jgi:hypothetical protein